MQDLKEKLFRFYQRENRMPTYSEMMGLFGYKSKNTVARIVDKFIDAGIVAKDRLGRLIPTDTYNELPYLGSVKAGFPSDVEELIEETVSLDGLLIKNKGETYLLEVDGDSMIDAHITSGDLVIAERVDSTYRPKDREIVIAEVDGEHTMKYYREKGTKVWLEAANKNYCPIYPENDMQIKAVVRGVVRKY